EPGPGIDVAADQQVAAVGVLLHEHRRDVIAGEAGGEQRAHREDVRISAAHHRDFLALKVRNLVDGARLGGDERRPFRPRIDVDRLDRIAVDSRDEGGGAGGRTEIDRSGVEELQRVARAVGLHPNHLDAVLGEFLLEEAFVLEQHRHRVVGRPIDVDFLGIVGGGELRARQHGERERAGQKRTAGQLGHDDLHAFEPRPRSRAGRPVDEGGIFCPPSAWRGGGPRALAAFVKRPQAACSNRRYIYFLGSPTRGVNENYLLNIGGAIGIIFILTRRPDIPLSSYSSGGGYGSPQRGPRDA